MSDIKPGDTVRVLRNTVEAHKVGGENNDRLKRGDLIEVHALQLNDGVMRVLYIWQQDGAVENFIPLSDVEIYGCTCSSMTLASRGCVCGWFQEREKQRKQAEENDEWEWDEDDDDEDTPEDDTDEWEDDD